VPLAPLHRVEQRDGNKGCVGKFVSKDRQSTGMIVASSARSIQLKSDVTQYDRQKCWKDHKVVEIAIAKVQAGNRKSIAADDEISLLSAFQTASEKKLRVNKVFVDSYSVLDIDHASRTIGGLKKMFATGTCSRERKIWLAKLDKLCPEARNVLIVPNAGGNSQLSECVSIQYFYERFGAYDIRLEEEIKYDSDFGMLDFSCRIRGITSLGSKATASSSSSSWDYGASVPTRVGISTTRAMKYPDPNLYTDEDAYSLLKRKMQGLIVSRQCVAESDSFYACFLHVLCQSQNIAEKIRAAYSKVVMEDDTGKIQEIIVLATVYKDSSIYTNRGGRDYSR
jgi:hypothetical protein